MIWIDTCNAPHVEFAKYLVNKYGEENVYITARNHSNTIPLLKLSGLRHDIVGKHWGRSKISKLIGLIWRSIQLTAIVKRKSIKVSFSQSSFYSPIVSKMLGIPCIYTNDNEYAIGNVLADSFANHVVYPNTKIFPKYRSITRAAIHHYDGLKESLYVKPQPEVDKSHRAKWYFRPEPENAQYIKSKANADILIHYANIAEKLKKVIIVLPRSHSQYAFYTNLKHPAVNVQSKIIPLNEIIETCQLFIGGGGTMSRELAISGVPTMSVYSGTKLYVDQLLEKADLLFFHEDGELDLSKLNTDSVKALPSNIAKIIDELIGKYL